MKALVLIKPDAVRRNLIGAIISELETVGFIVDNLKFLRLTDDQLRTIYDEHIFESYWPRLLYSLCTGPSVALVVSNSETESLKGLFDTKNRIRSKYQNSENPAENVIHCSDDQTRVEKEIEAVFPGWC